MEKFSRREFLSLLGMGGVGMMAAATVPSWALSNAPALPMTRKENYSFRAIGGLPQDPFPSYASYVIEGTISLASGSGIITKNVFAGPPGLTSTITIPGLTRVVRVTKVLDGPVGSLLVTGVVDDGSQLQAGERARVDMMIDHSAGVVRSTFLNSGVTLKIA
jgi:hypothetical protein